MQELRGMPAAKALNESLAVTIKELNENGIIPKLAVVRVGAREDDIAYENGILKRFSTMEALVDVVTLPETVTLEELESTIISLNEAADVHGILLFRPLPKHLSEERIKSIIDSSKDVDCMGLANNAHLFMADKQGYPPCTPQAVIEMLDFYNIELTGKNVVVVGRSMVVGKPLSILLLGKNATVTICHTKTKDLTEVCKKADIIIACAGVAKMITSDFVAANQIIIDVGINMLDGALCGDVDFDAVADKVQAITPVPGGVGSVTTSVLLKHTVLNAKAQFEREYHV